MLLFRQLAVRLLPERPRLIAVAIFAVSFYPIRHATEVKPYAFDLFVALVLIVLAVEWLRAREQTRWLWCLAMTTPLCLGLSYPSVFIAGAVSLALALPVWRSRKTANWCGYALFNLLLIVTFIGLLGLVTDRQYEYTADGLRIFWGRRFPPLDNLRELPAWLLNAHTGRMFAYPVGDDRGMSTVNFLLCCLGAVILWRLKSRATLVLLVAPLPAMFVAAALHRYPYGGSGRVFQHIVPAICVLMALGASQVIAWIHREAWRFRGHARVAGALALLGVGILGLSIARPYKQKFDREIRDLAEVVSNKSVDVGELQCLASDCREEFARAAFIKAGGPRVQLLCNRRIVHERMLAEHRVETNSVRPLRYALFRPLDEESDPAERVAWLRRMEQQSLVWSGYERHVLRCSPSVRPRQVCLEVYEFAPDQPGTPRMMSQVQR
jgi:hypothetical protein